MASAWLEDLWRDLKYAVRTLRRAPGFTAVAVVTVALGIGINVTVFTVTRAFLFKGFPQVAGNDRILYVSSRGYGCCASYPDLQDWRAQAKSFTEMAAVRGIGVILGDEKGFAERYDATEVTANTFALIGQAPSIGRDFVASDETPGAAPVAILSYGFWEHRYGKDPGAVGRAVRMNGVPTTIVGVMPDGFSFPQKQDLWMPLVPTPEIEKRESRVLWFAFGRLADGVTIGGARAEMDMIGKRLARAYPLTNEGQLPVVQTFDEFFIGPSAAAIYGAMWAAVGFVLLIACANLANLMLSRALGRSREISLRIALGAARSRIVRQLLVESLMLSLAGGIVGLWIARWGVRTYALAIAHKSPWLVADYTLDHRVFAYLIALSIVTGLLFGLVPAHRLSRPDLNRVLKDGGSGATRGARARRLSSGLVIGQMALALPLLAGAGVMIRSFWNIYSADLGVSTGNILAASFGLDPDKYRDGEAQMAFYERLQRRQQAVPGVDSVALATAIPTTGSLKLPYELAGAAPVDERRRPKLSALTISPGYFTTLGRAVRSGREFTEFDTASAAPVAIVNQRFASTYWPDRDPLAQRLRLFDGTKAGPWLTVVGVAPDIVQNDLTRQQIDPVVYLAFRQRPAAHMWVLARTMVTPGSLATAFRQEVQALDPDLPMFGPFPLAERLETWNYWSSGLNGAVFLIFAAVALLLASVGLYAVISQSVVHRTREIGVRMAIGATAGDILRLVLAQGMLPSATGLALGLAAALAVMPLLRSALVHVSPADPVTLIAASAGLVISGALGCLLPALRAIRVDPVVALRHE